MVKLYEDELEKKKNGGLNVIQEETKEEKPQSKPQ